MKPYGREKNIKGRTFKKDYHLKKDKLINWWEDICEPIPRSTMKQNIKKEIKKEIEQ